MSAIHHGRCFGLGLLCCVALALLASPVRGQPRVDIVTAPADAPAVRQLEAIRESLQAKDWETAVRAMQKLLDLPEDRLIAVKERQADKTASRVVSVRTEVQRLLAGLPEDGKRFAAGAFGVEAEKLLKEAIQHADSAMLYRVYQRYPLTQAAARALEELARLEEITGRPQRAAMALELLLQRRGIADWTPKMQYLAARVFTRTGDQVHAASVVKELSARLGKFGIKIDGQLLKAEDLALELERLAGAARDWPMAGGNLARNAQRESLAPLLEPLWTKKTSEQTQTRAWLKKAADILQGQLQPILPAASPIVVSVARGGHKVPVVICRTWRGIEAKDLKTGALVWRSDSLWSMDMMARKIDRTPYIQNWVEYYLEQQPSTLFENSVLGTLSADNRYLYAIDDLAIPSRPDLDDADVRFTNIVRVTAQVADAIAGSRLQAFDLVSGKLRWELGLKGSDLADSYFLAPPLPVDGQLYVLVQKQHELRLCTLEQKNGKVIANTRLAEVGTPMRRDHDRRMRAAHLSCADGVLVCSTNAGAVFGVDLQTGSPAWAHLYREASKAPAEKKRLWQGGPPIIADGKVIVADVDSPSIECVDLHNGVRLWSVPLAETDCYLGGAADGKLLVVGTRHCRALALDKGTESWKLTTGMPSGHGALGRGLYLLPLQAGATTGNPELCVIDLAQGKVRSHIPTKNGEALGNLVLAQGVLLSQTPLAVAAFPDRAALREQINERLKADPKDAVALGNRACMRLDEGNFAGGIDDLRAALGNKPEEKERLRFERRLFDAYSDILQRDWAAGAKFLDHYRALADFALPKNATPDEALELQAERERRRMLSLVIIGAGAQSAGKVAEAVRAYLEMAGREPAGLFPAPDDPTLHVSRPAWARGRIRDLLAVKDDAARRRALAAIEERWQAAQQTKDIGLLRAFAETLGNLPQGREAQWLLAQHFLGKKNEREARRFLEMLRRHNDTSLQARVVLRLAQFATEKKRLQEAADYYEILRRDFNAVKVLDGKTGAEVYDDVMSDKRLLPFLGNLPFPRGKIQVATEGRAFRDSAGFPLTRSGATSPFWNRHELRLKLTGMQDLLLVDRAGKPLWSQATRDSLWSNRTLFLDRTEVPEMLFYPVGEFVVLPLRHVLIGIDPVQRKIVWEKDLFARRKADQMVVTKVSGIDPLDGTRLVTYPGGWVMRCNQPATVTPGSVCIQTPTGLQCLEPLTGQVLWARSAVEPALHLFGDDEVLFLAEPGEGNTIGKTMAVRRLDGRKLPVADFGALYARHLSQHGRALLLRETDGKGDVVLHLHDVLAGKDLWSRTFPPRTVIVSSREPRFTGAVQPDGKAVVLETASGKEAFQMQLDADKVKDVEGVVLLADDSKVYLALRRPVDAARISGKIASNLTADSGLRSAPVNGDLIALERATGKPRWSVALPNQTILVHAFAEMPVLVITSRYQQWITRGGERTTVTTASLRIVDKLRGKVLYRDETMDGSEIDTVQVEPAHGQIVIETGRKRVIVSVLKGQE